MHDLMSAIAQNSTALVSGHSVLAATTTVSQTQVQGIVDFCVTLVHFAQAIAAAIAAVFFVWGAIQKMSSRGNPRQSETAVETMINSAVGLGLVFLTLIIVNVLAGAFNATALPTT